MFVRQCRGPEDHIVQTMDAGIPLVLGLRTITWDWILTFVCFVGPLVWDPVFTVLHDLFDLKQDHSFAAS